MKFIYKIIFVLSFLFCIPTNGQQIDTTGFHYKRMWQRLKTKGYSSEEIKKQIALADSLFSIDVKKELEEEVEKISLRINNQSTANSSCNDIPSSEKAVLLALYNQLHLSSWAIGWNFDPSSVVTSWNNQTQTGWKGITVQNCHVVSIIISDNSVYGSLPDMTNLTELKFLSISPTNGSIGFTTGNYLIDSNSNFSSIGNLTKLVGLHLNNADFGGSLPSNFSNLSPIIDHFSLPNCNLNNLSQLTSIISTFSELRYLSLGHNYNNNSITNYPLPSSFSNLSKLEIISIWRSKISNIDVISSLIHLKVIDFQSNNINQLFPDVSNNVNLLTFGSNTLFDIILDDNEIFGTIPTYFENKDVRHFRVGWNNLNGIIPTLNFNNYNYGTFYIHNNNFRFNDFIDDFNTYNTTPHLQYFGYSPQAKTDNTETINAIVGQQITLTMYQDGNFHADDSYQWYRNGTAISGANSRQYIFTASPTTTGIYHCRSKHFNPPMTNNSTNNYKNLTLYRNDVTVNVVEAPPPCVDCTSFNLLLGEKYVISGWVKESNLNGDTNNNIFQYQNSAIDVSFYDVNGTQINSTQSFIPIGEIIDGWQLIKGEFIVPTNVDDMKIELVNNNISLNSFFDDIRVHPFKANLKSFVYDQATQKLMAELDENNYATFYQYDKEGGLVRVKKETEKGVYTIQETRSGNKKTSN